MPENTYERRNRMECNYTRLISKFQYFHAFSLVVMLHTFIHMTSAQLPTKVINIQKSFQEVPIINLSDLSPQLESVTLLIDTGSSQLAIFDDQCDQCEHTFSACPHVKNQSNQTFISYLLTQFKGDYSYLTLGNSIRMRFFCVIQIEGSQNGLQANGVLGIHVKKINLLDNIIKETNGLKVWRQVMTKIYQPNLKNLQQTQNTLGQKDAKSQELPPLRLKYSIFYSPYHTKLILGQIPEIYSKKVIAEFSLSLQTKANFLCYFPDKCSQNSVNGTQFQDTIVHFDSGSSVFVLPWNHFEQMFTEINSTIPNQCIIENMGIKCQKNSINSFLDSGFKFQISMQRNHESTQDMKRANLSISLQNLIQKTHKKQQDSYFYLSIIGHNKTNPKSQEFIILGVPLFKQYLAQYDIPFQMEKKGLIQSLKNGIKPNDEYKLILFDPRQKESEQLQSPYEHLVKKYQKNIKLFTFFYLFFVFVFTYFVIKVHWWIDQFIKGKRQLV